MELFAQITENKQILAIVSLYAAVAWIASNTITIRSFLSKKHDLDLIKLKLDINISCKEQFNGNAPFSENDIRGEIDKSQEIGILKRTLYKSAAFAAMIFYWGFTLLSYIFGFLMFLNLPVALWFYQQITFVQAITMFLTVILITGGSSLSANFFSELKDNFNKKGLTK